MEIVDNKKLWSSVLVEIELSVSKANFNTWFKDTYILKQEEGVIYLATPNTFVKEWLSHKYHNFILRILRTLSPDIRSLEYVITKNQPKSRTAQSQTGGAVTDRFAASHTTGGTGGGELPLEEHYINKEDNLNPRYGFDSFIVGPFNELAYAASQAIVKQPGRIYNPLFVYGDTGHGKTHLIQAIGNALKNEEGANRKIFYVTSERFAIDYINAIQANKVTPFKEKYRKYDILIMDDIQFLSSKEKTQEELFHLFNTLYDNNKQIIFSSDKHPNYIPGLEDRLKSRFSAGMIVDIPAPDKESRAAILREKAKMNNVELDPDVVEHIAFSVEGNVRDLEGIINSVLCQQELKGRPLNVSEVKQVIKSSEKPKKTMSAEEVIKTIANFYNIDEQAIYQKTRRKEVIKPRQLIMYIMREDFSSSYPSIGQKLGGRDHTTVIHSCEKIREELKTDTALHQELSQIRALMS
ncbi:MAG: chromosomal replication initiator protein DnaA [Candidatus Paceibacterota bacterium]